MYELIITDKRTGRMWDISETVTEVQLETYRTGSPGKLTFTWLKISEEVHFFEGDVVRFSVDGQVQFYGWVFTKSKDRWNVFTVTCYDRLRYLKANASYAFYSMSAGDIIRQIAEDLQISVGTIEDTGYLIPSLIESSKPCIDIIQDAIGQTLLNTGTVYVLYDDGEGLSLRAASGWVSDYVLGDESYVTDYTYKTDIDSDTYNSVKLAHPNESTGKTDVVIAQDSANIARWGLLQLYKSVDGDVNLAQMNSQAEQTLSFYNRRRRTFSLSALGVLGLRAGQMLRVVIDNLGDIDLNRIMLLERVTHTFVNDDHTMEIETLDW